ncbi:unnamed protein product [Eruca vesicaria subsp. sativa]|uniref:Uncharacterized protein n=1 Tax=Eruca vesicaria subsp. sativa TaxID=29727 RepID=A0ABC8K190_ERUVS|nr:unnamed protein product [Eruca vesicaria subsp. sativa]
METHGAATRKNKERQEKLPVVVLKAEDIMYSKSNSEMLILCGIESVMPLTPLLEEMKALKYGPLLPPCVEAALNLGCIAVRASTSQRHSNVRTYLCPKIQKPVSAPPHESQYHHHQAQMSNKPSYVAQPVVPVAVLDDAPVPINLGSVYPLYYGSDNQTQQVNMSLRVPETPIITGMPISIKAPEERTESFCDLSLRLGLSSSDPPSTRIDVGFSRAYQGRNQEELCFFS